MTTQYLSGRGMTWPDMGCLPGITDNVPALATTMLIDASAELCAFVGRVWWPGSSTSKAIHTVHIRLGAVTAGTATFRCSLQDVSTAAGPPQQPDGVVDQSATIATSGLTANAINSFTMDADRTVTRGDLLAIVFDYSAFTSGASIVISGLTTQAADANQGAGIGGVALLNTASWAINATTPNVILEMADGSIGGLFVNTPFSVLNSRSFASNTTGSGGLNAGDERGLEFTVPFPMTVDGMWFQGGPSTNAANFDVVLYDGTSALQTVSCDANAVLATGNRNIYVPFAAPQALTTSATYRLVLKPTTTTAITLVTLTLRVAADRVLLHGTTCSGNSRVDAGAWGTTDTTELPAMALNVIAFDDATGGGSTVGYRVKQRMG